jgi:hypothetical protein
MLMSYNDWLIKEMGGHTKSDISNVKLEKPVWLALCEAVQNPKLIIEQVKKINQTANIKNGYSWTCARLSKP